MRTITFSSSSNSGLGITCCLSSNLSLSPPNFCRIFHFPQSYHDQKPPQTSPHLSILCTLSRVLNRFWIVRRNMSICYPVMKNLCSWTLQGKLSAPYCRPFPDRWTRHSTNVLRMRSIRFRSKVCQIHASYRFSIIHRSARHLWNIIPRDHFSGRIICIPRTYPCQEFLPLWTTGQGRSMPLELETDLFLTWNFCSRFVCQTRVLLG